MSARGRHVAVLTARMSARGTPPYSRHALGSELPRAADHNACRERSEVDTREVAPSAPGHASRHVAVLVARESTHGTPKTANAGVPRTTKRAASVPRSTPRELHRQHRGMRRGTLRYSRHAKVLTARFRQRTPTCREPQNVPQTIKRAASVPRSTPRELHRQHRGMRRGTPRYSWHVKVLAARLRKRTTACRGPQRVPRTTTCAANHKAFREVAPAGRARRAVRPPRPAPGPARDRVTRLVE
jgi:hypothetical protein